MKINGLEGLTDIEIHNEVKRGGRFVIFYYCISIILLTFKQPSDIYFVRPDDSAVSKGLLFSIVTALLGWWGIPWGPIYSIQSLVINLGGGKDVTREVMASIQPRQMPNPSMVP